ncbi:MAG TPA: hypothetical protein VMQ38_12155 [Mycobacterium sp.]|nr:hypothetical protein [Mycobacterium sp.]
MSDGYVALHDPSVELFTSLSAYRRQAFSNLCSVRRHCGQAVDSRQIGPSTGAIAHIIYRCRCVGPPADQSEAQGDDEVTAVATRERYVLVMVHVEEASASGRDQASREATGTLTPSVVIVGGRRAQDVEAGAESRGRERLIRVAEAGRQHKPRE